MILGLFSADQVRRLTGLSEHQLRYWDNTAFFSPWRLDAGPHRPYNRIYSYRDLVGLRAVAILRNSHRIPLQELRKVGKWLRDQYDTPWSSLSFFVAGKAVVFEIPDGILVSNRPLGQIVHQFMMDAVVQDIRSQIETLRQRPPEEIGQIRRNRNIAANAYCIAGTRIPTSSIWDFHQAGFEVPAIMVEYPRLTREDVEAAIKFESSRLKKEAS